MNTTSNAVIASFCTVAVCISGLCLVCALMVDLIDDHKVELNTLRSRVSHNEHRIEELRMEHGLLIREEVR